MLDLIDYCYRLEYSLSLSLCIHTLYRKITHLIAAPGKVYDNNVTNNPDASINEVLC